jgi:hypothetical protein
MYAEISERVRSISKRIESNFAFQKWVLILLTPSGKQETYLNTNIFRIFADSIA